MGRLQPELNEKHLKALELIREGKHTLKEVARIVGFSEQYFYDLMEGDVAKTSAAAALFHEELKKIEKGLTQRIRWLTKDTQEVLLAKFNEIARNLPRGDLDQDILKNLVSILNALNKSTPGVEIGSFSYTKGLTAEDLVNEFKRLKALASDGRRVYRLGTGQSGSLPGSAAEGSDSAQEPEAPVL